MNNGTHVAQPPQAVPKLESEFTIVAIVRDRRAGEATFSADELRASLVNSFSDLHLEVEAIRVMTPMYSSGKSAILGGEVEKYAPTK
jgi:hypothetical protein